MPIVSLAYLPKNHRGELSEKNHTKDIGVSGEQKDDIPSASKTGNTTVYCKALCYL